MSLYLPKDYHNLLGGTEQTEKAIKSVKDMFQDNLSAQLALLRVTAPMTVLSGTGIDAVSADEILVKAAAETANQVQIYWIGWKTEELNQNLYGQYRNR